MLINISIAWMHTQYNSVWENSRDSLSNARAASQMWECYILSNSRARDS